MSLHTPTGARKYLTAGERDAFLHAAEHADRTVRTLCMTLAYASCRLSEALALIADRVHLAAGRADLRESQETPHRHLPGRAIPLPLVDALDLVHGIREVEGRRGKGRGIRLWPWSRMTGCRAVHGIMQAARLDGPHAFPKGLRHGFGAAVVSAGIPLISSRNGSDTHNSPPPPCRPTPSAPKNTHRPPEPGPQRPGGRGCAGGT